MKRKEDDQTRRQKIQTEKGLKWISTRGNRAKITNEGDRKPRNKATSLRRQRRRGRRTTMTHPGGRRERWPRRRGEGGETSAVTRSRCRPRGLGININTCILRRLTVSRLFLSLVHPPWASLVPTLISISLLHSVFPLFCVCVRVCFFISCFCLSLCRCLSSLPSLVLRALTSRT